MATLTNSSLMLLVFSLAVILRCCSASCNNITTEMSKTGRVVLGKDEFKVEVINNCDCPQSFATLKCVGFETLEPVDPTIFVKIEDTCYVRAGQSIPPRASVEFNYADRCGSS